MNTVLISCLQLESVQSQIDTRPPHTFNHLHLKLKKLQVSNCCTVNSQHEQILLWYIGVGDRADVKGNDAPSRSGLCRSHSWRRKDNVQPVTSVGNWHQEG